jgi:transcription initiation factor TFIIE subunit beta
MSDSNFNSRSGSRAAGSARRKPDWLYSREEELKSCHRPLKPVGQSQLAHKMTSYLDAQLGAFKSSLSSSSTKLANKRTIQTTSTPSPAPSHASTSSKPDLKRKRPEVSSDPYSQPALTGHGQHLTTRIHYAQQYLKEKDAPLTLDAIISYLSLQHEGDNWRYLLKNALPQHDKISYDPKGAGGKGTYTYRPKLPIKTEQQLVGYLQKQTTAQGIKASDLLDGWPDAEGAIRDLENVHKLLVIRHKKDNNAKAVWLDDPTLAVHIDQEFKDIWYKIKLPEPAALADELEKMGLTPANKSRNEKVATNVVTKKTKKPRRSGKITNRHMEGILRDYPQTK